jgi:uncharacterized protein involved in oxidation of intracellular sulfur
MKIGIIISTDEVETCFNALRYANFCLKRKEEVKVFFIGKGVEYQKVSTEKLNTIEQANKFLQTGGKVYACGACIKYREQKGSEICPISTMKDMYDIVKESEKVLTF